MATKSTIGAGHVMVGARKSKTDATKSTQNLRWVRFALSGALLGIAVSGILGTHLGWDKEATDATGAVLGAGVTAFLVKAIHLV